MCQLQVAETDTHFQVPDWVDLPLLFVYQLDMLNPSESLVYLGFCFSSVFVRLQNCQPNNSKANPILFSDIKVTFLSTKENCTGMKVLYKMIIAEMQFLKYRTSKLGLH